MSSYILSPPSCLWSLWHHHLAFGSSMRNFMNTPCVTWQIEQGEVDLFGDVYVRIRRAGRYNLSRPSGHLHTHHCYTSSFIYKVTLLIEIHAVYLPVVVATISAHATTQSRQLHCGIRYPTPNSVNCRENDPHCSHLLKETISQ